MFTLPDRLRGLVVEHARQRDPEEIGGLLALHGRAFRDYVPLRNVSRLPEYEYVPAPRQLLEALRRGDGGALLHSHGRGPAWPSAGDRVLFGQPWMAVFQPFVIMALEQGEPVFRAFDADGNQLELGR